MTGRRNSSKSKRYRLNFKESKEKKRSGNSCLYLVGTMSDLVNSFGKSDGD